MTTKTLVSYMICIASLQLANAAAAQSEKPDWTQTTAQQLLQDIRRESAQLQTLNSKVVQNTIRTEQELQKQQERLSNTIERHRSILEQKNKDTEKLQRLTQEHKKLTIAEENTRLMTHSNLNDFLNKLQEDTERSLSTMPQPETAAAPDGTLLSGWKINAGPYAFFKTSEKPIRFALLQISPTQQHPSIFWPADQKDEQQLQRLFDFQLATIPLDPSGGKAMTIITHQDSLYQHLRKGGIIIIPLLTLAIIAALVILIKVCQFTRLNPYLDTLRSIAADHASLTADALEEKLYLTASRQTAHLERYLSTLAVCASAAPLLGLLGTVTGMIHTFSLITVYGTGDPRLLSTGISEALITTEVGLIIAIPAILAHAWLSRKLKRFRFQQQQLAISLLPQPPAGNLP